MKRSTSMPWLLLVSCFAASVCAPPLEAAGKKKDKKEKRKDKEKKDADGKPAAAASREESVDEGLIDLEFRYGIFECVKDRVHPPVIEVQVYIDQGGSVHLQSIEPRPMPEVYQCILQAAGEAGADPGEPAGTTAYPVLLPYPYEHVGEGWGRPRAQAQTGITPYRGPVLEPPPPPEPPPFPPPPPPPPPPKRYSYPHRKDGGFGLYGSFIMLDRGRNTLKISEATNRDEEWYGQLSGGFGIFLEGRLGKRLLLGLELAFSLPKIKHLKSEGGEKTACGYCQRDVIVRLLLRTKIPIMIARRTALYPLLALGYSDYISRAEGRNKLDFHGVTLGLGFGLEVLSLKDASPFVEVRYMFSRGWEKENQHDEDFPLTKEQELLHHELGLLLGLRIP